MGEITLLEVVSKIWCSLVEDSHVWHQAFSGGVIGVHLRYRRLNQ